jgi:hypothetical protein
MAVTAEVRDRVGWITLDRPPANSYDAGFLEELDQAIGQVGEAEVADASRGAGQRAKCAVPEAELVLLEVVVVEDAPRPANHSVGMNVRDVVETVLADRLVADAHEFLQIVQSECIRCPHGCDDAGDTPPSRDHVANRRLECVDAHLIVVGGRH